ncbi:hypothetical protein [Shimia sediminis]|uniref:hypothetical protein n=1 Tax=Shimia sediminis TaxID=2497945 RepID=UPI000F8C6742|nr:hypothetical protein [Shimia sediminis]
MTKLKTLAATALIFAFAGSGFALEQTEITPSVQQSTPQSSTLDSEYRLSQTATCILDGKRYNKGARMCIGGVYNYCNSKGLWEPSNQTC